MPKTLFWRLVMLLMASLAVAVLAVIFLFRQDRASLIARNFTEAKIAQIESLRVALSKASTDVKTGRGPQLQMIAREYGVMLIPVDRRPEIGQVPKGRFNRAPKEAWSYEKQHSGAY